MIVYIAGPMTSKPGKNRERFAAAEEYLKAKGHVVLNPAILPEGLDEERYLPICLDMIDAADALYMLDGWKRSPGACVEKLYAMYQQKEFMYEYGA